MGFKHGNWKGKTGGMPWMQAFLIAWCRHVGVKSLYFVMALVVPFYMLLNHKGYLASYHYFRQRFSYSPLKSFISVYRNHYVFGQVILDRFAMYGGCKFRFHHENEAGFLDLCGKEEGMVLLSAHIGNYELAGYSLKAGKKKFNTLVFGGETATVMRERAEAFAKNNIRMVEVREDLSHIFTLNDALGNGEIVSLPADRIFGSAKSLKCSFLGAEATFPIGAFTLAAGRDVPVVAISVMREKDGSYSIFSQRLMPEGYGGLPKKERAGALAEEFVSYLEKILRRYPEQWFNYYEFWQDEL